MTPITEAEQERLDERIAIMMEGAALSESDAHKLALEAIMVSRMAKMDGRAQARELARKIRGH